MIKYLDDPTALDEVNSRIAKVVGREAGALTWSRHRGSWLSKVDEYVKAVPSKSEIFTRADLRRVEHKANALAQGLLAAEAEIAELREKNELLVAAASAEEAREIQLPVAEKQRFMARVKAVRHSLESLPSIISDVVHAELFSEDGGMWRPNRSDDVSTYDALEDAEKRGFLSESEGLYTLRTGSKQNLTAALRAASELSAFLSGELDGPRSETFLEWFPDEYDDWKPDLRAKDVWDLVI